ncbi:MAG: hypothetical protein WCO56_16040 [Verrucomicrobiota bacterium]
MGLRFSLPEENNAQHTHHLWALCQYLTVKVIHPFFAANHVEWDPRFVDFFMHSRDSNPFEATGAINFYPPLRFAGQSETLETAINAALNEAGIVTGPFEREYYAGQPAVKVVRIPILQNASAQSGPPEVTMPNNAGRIIMSKLFGYQPKQGQFEFEADDLLCKAASVTDEMIATQCASPLRELGTSPNGLPRTASPITVKSVRRCLDELKQLARWAREHQYRKISAAI